MTDKLYTVRLYPEAGPSQIRCEDVRADDHQWARTWGEKTLALLGLSGKVYVDYVRALREDER